MGSSAQKEKDSGQNLTNQCQEAITELCRICGKEGDDRQWPLNIVCIGMHGAGKSSFVNGVAAALSEDRWQEYASTGNQGRGAPVTTQSQRLEKCCNGHRERYQKVLLPTLIDVAGLPDKEDDELEELLRLLFYGHIEEGERLMSVYENIRNRTVEDIRLKYNQTYPEMRVDRVVFVASASAEDPLPVRLMGCVHSAAQPHQHRVERRAVPLYGVLTKMDKVDRRTPDYQQKEKKFMKILKLNQTRFLVCSNYCDDINPQGQRYPKLKPELDLPVLQFMQEVCGKCPGVVEDDEVLPPSGQQNAPSVWTLGGLDQPCRGELAARQRALDPTLRHVLEAVGLAVVAVTMLWLILTLVNPQTADWAGQLKAESWYYADITLRMPVIFIFMAIIAAFYCFVAYVITQLIWLIIKRVWEIMKAV